MHKTLTLYVFYRKKVSYIRGNSDTKSNSPQENIRNRHNTFSTEINVIFSLLGVFPLFCP